MYAIAAVYTALGYSALATYLNYSLTPLLALAALFVAPVTSAGHHGTRRCYYAALFMAVLTWWLPASTFLYFTIVFALMFLVESYLVRLNAIPLFLAAVAAPIFEYAVTVFSFPLRVQLTSIAGDMLSQLGNVSVEGNMITFNGAEFSVDPACMGLHMLAVSLVAGLALTGVQGRRMGRRLSWHSLLLMLATMLALNIVCNLCRIVMIVNFRLLPGTVGHEIAGLACFALYVLLPAGWLSGQLLRRFGKPFAHNNNEYTPKSHATGFNLSLLVIVALLVGMRPAMPPLPVITVPAGYAAQQIGEVTKIQQEAVLIYVKPIRSFYATDHHPTICWQGSGFRFKKVQEEVWDGFAVYTAVLEKGAQRLYTAWWYDSGRHAGISQWQWRWNALLTGDSYAVHNVTVMEKEELRAEAMKWRQHFKNSH